MHQPNYMPWLGYFYKIYSSDVFIFLDDVQFSKNSYINRSQIFGSNEKKRWLTIPVSVHLGQNIDMVQPISVDWVERHIDTLYGLYKNAQYFDSVWPDILKIYNKIDSHSNLAEQNSTIIIEISNYLGLECGFLNSSSMSVKKTGDDRIISIISGVSSSATYLSGRGAEKYQNPNKFLDAGFGFEYINFPNVKYVQWSSLFQDGLSILDPIFHIGQKGVIELFNSIYNEK